MYYNCLYQYILRLFPLSKGTLVFCGWLYHISQHQHAIQDNNWFCINILRICTDLFSNLFSIHRFFNFVIYLIFLYILCIQYYQSFIHKPYQYFHKLIPLYYLQQPFLQLGHLNLTLNTINCVSLFSLRIHQHQFFHFWMSNPMS